VKRDPALVSLSRDHHQALSVGLKLRRANPETANVACSALFAYWEGHGRAHFRSEEEVLLPAYARYADPYDPLVARVLCDHVAIRQRILALQNGGAQTPAALHELGELISAHVALEERELFERIEREMPTPELAALATALERAHVEH
jgi:hemerythrin-like domain-containing protein